MSLVLTNLKKQNPKAESRNRQERAGNLSIFSTSENLLSQMFTPCLLCTGLVYIAISFYCIFFRGFTSNFFDDNDSINGQGNQNKNVYVASVLSNDSTSRLMQQAQMFLVAKQLVSDNEAIASSAKLAAAGIWTSSSLLGPLLHILGVLAVSPTWYCLFMSTDSSKLRIVLPLNIFTIMFSEGIPTLRSASWLGLILGSHRWFEFNRKQMEGRISH